MGEELDVSALQIAVGNTETKEDETALTNVGGPVTLANFRRIQLLGTGGIGKVFLVHTQGLTPSGVYAMKVLKKAEIVARNKVERLWTERDVLARMHFPFTVSLHYAFQTRKKLYFVMDYAAGGELFRHLRQHKNKRLPEEHVRFYAAELLLALEYMHAMGVIYRDLKPENILIHGSGHLLLTDFDLSSRGGRGKQLVKPSRAALAAAATLTAAASDRSPSPRKKTKKRFSFFKRNRRGSDYPTVNAESHINARRTKSFVGTPEYVSPEILAGDGYGGSIDWWSYGILLYEMLFGETPFKGGTTNGTLANINDVKRKIAFPPDVQVSKAAKKLLKQLLSKKRAKRLVCPQKMKLHPFFADIDFLALRDTTPPSVPTLRHALDTTHFYDYAALKPELLSSDEAEALASGSAEAAMAAEAAATAAAAPAADTAATAADSDGGEQDGAVVVGAVAPTEASAADAVEEQAPAAPERSGAASETTDAAATASAPTDTTTAATNEAGQGSDSDGDGHGTIFEGFEFTRDPSLPEFWPTPVTTRAN